MTPDRILEALKQLVLAGLAFATSLGGAAGGLPARLHRPAAVREVLSVPRLPSDELLTVDETDISDEDGEEPEDDLEELDPEELDGPVDVRYLALRGPITARPAGGVIGTWTIAGRDVEVTATTVVSTRAANASVGDWAQARVEVQAPEDEETDEDEESDGEEELVLDTLVARSLSVMSSTHLGRVVGVIQSIGEEDENGASTWVVSGVSVTVQGSTHVVGTPAVGRLADVHGDMTVEEPAAGDEGETAGENENDNDDDSGDEAENVASVSFVARLVVVRGTPNLPKEERQREKVQKRSTFRFTGTIESIDTDTGLWVIGGQTVQVTSATRVNEKKGVAEAEAAVRVLAEQDESGNLVALEIEVLQASGGKKAGPEARPPKDNPGQGKKK